MIHEPDSEPVHNLRDATFLLDRNIEKAEVISTRLEEGIQHYKAEGKDVSKLEALLEKYNLLIEEAKKYRALADAAVDEENNSSITNSDLENCSSENTRREYLIRSQKSMIQANIVLKEIFDEFQRHDAWERRAQQYIQTQCGRRRKSFSYWQFYSQPAP